MLNNVNYQFKNLSSVLYVFCFLFFTGSHEIANAVTNAQMTSPNPSSVLTGYVVTFSWTNVGAGAYYLQTWAYDNNNNAWDMIYSKSQGTNTSVTGPIVPTNGQHIYVRLWTWLGSHWEYKDYRYIAYKSAKGDPANVGDVVGRELARTWFSFPGHVGLWTGSRVLEVMNEPPYIIQVNTLNNFKTRIIKGEKKAVYWGAKARYASKNLPNVIAAAREQINYNPSYTLTATYLIGGQGWRYQLNSSTNKYEWKNITVDGKFRCDTFVNYAFDKGDNSHILPMTKRWKISYGWDFNDYAMEAFTDNSAGQRILPVDLFNKLQFIR